MRLAELSLPAPLTEDGVTMWAEVEVKLCDSGRDNDRCCQLYSWWDVGTTDNESSCAHVSPKIGHTGRTRWSPTLIAVLGLAGPAALSAGSGI